MSNFPIDTWSGDRFAMSAPRRQAPGVTPLRPRSPSRNSTLHLLATQAFHPPQAAAQILAEIRPVEPGGSVELDQPVAAHVVPDPRLTDPAVEDVPADLAVVGEEMPVVAGDVQPPDPRRAADAHERPAHVLVRPDRLALRHLTQRPVGRLLAVDAPQGDRGETTIDPDGEEVVLLRQDVVQAGVKVGEAAGLGTRELAVLPERRDDRKGSRAVGAHRLDHAIATDLIRLPI